MTFTLPQTTDWMKEQMLHEPTYRYSKEIYGVVKDFPYESALEIGCIWACSTLSILTAGKGKLLSVDPIPQNNPNMHAMVEVRHNGLTDRWGYFTGRSREFWEKNDKTFDLIYIDGSHNYADVKLDLYEAWKVLKPGGLLMTDDTWHKGNISGDYGTAVATWEFIKDHKITKINTGEFILWIFKDESNSN